MSFAQDGSKPIPLDELGPDARLRIALLPHLAPQDGRARRLQSKGELSERLKALSAACGCAIEAVGLADHAWAAAATSACPDEDEVICAVEIPDGTAHTRLLTTAQGRLVSLRRLPLEAAPIVVEEALRQLASSFEPRPPGAARLPVLALGDGGFRAAVAESAVRADLQPVEPVGVVAKLECQPEAVAAAFAGAGPCWVPPGVVAIAKARNRRRAVMSAAVAALLLVVSAALDTLDLRRELETVRALRAEHAEPVAELMDAREAASEFEATVLDLEGLRRELPRWTLLFSSLGAGLPESAHVTSLRAAGDSLYLELEGPDVSAAFDAIRQIPWLEEFRSVAPVQREVGEGSDLTERLTARATVSWVDLNSSR